ncbi:Ig-like domain-containing protein [Mycolicibacterium austroafricanum]|uniref:Ig-like domain-containing protein n=1 Tax=Mycolicibacterium austroafricanum TaxID=39687 RepID=UPI001F20E61B|nr:Ig-like domain-containing protein [Mycolicibacterium austroafricanum]
MRSWLKLGAASAGLGAALLGFALVGPSPVAEADTGTESSVSTGPEKTTVEQSGSEEADAADNAEVETGEDSDELHEADGDRNDRDGEATDDAVGEATDGADGADDADGADGADGEATDGADGEATDDRDGEGSHVGGTSQLIDTPEIDAEPGTSHLSAAAEDDDIPAAPTPSPYVSPESAYQRWVARVLDEWTAQNQAWVNSLDVPDDRKERLQASFLTMRRTFFNQAPTVAPVQITGVVTGPVTGSLGGEDPDGDRLVFIVTRAPSSGGVRINEDGTYTYTPDDDFDGVDTFRVAAIDLGLHVNLLQLLRPVGSRAATSLINQGAIRFAFDYTAGEQYWTDERRDALQAAADELIEYFRVTKAVSLTYEVKGEDNPSSDTLASAFSSLSDREPGFWATVVQEKLLTGEDANGSAADGGIEWNFGKGWALGDDVPGTLYDFRAVALHELLHSFGFSSRIGEAGDNDNLDWTIFAGFVVDRHGARPIGADGRWDDDFDPNLTGGDGGLFFGGANAVAAYGGLIPLYTPEEWESGSSMGHLDDDTFDGADEKVMNANTGKGPAVRALSALELGILSDLGYLVYPRSDAAALVKATV